ncbi:MAG: hypothetical protein B6D55_01515 [Candidatus Omnitrophica bacterium 4484_70.2]|nr:MAG: hypothetical protein B6D55_01515 [Candidatus Omnitrophica bacterium 4484_70.2]RKY84623.1 MAG: hypothetical protein DRQ11_11280 [candidate division KSB1 bacterium]
MNILVTAGPTWVKIDEIRVITNIFTGRSGLFIAEEFKKRGYEVTLVINPHCIEKLPSQIEVIPFQYFDELARKIKNELRRKRYDIIIHSAAVSDYKPIRKFNYKISSKRKQLILKLVPTEKIIKTIRERAKSSFLVQFKLEITRKKLLEKAYRSLKENGSDLVVANAWEDLKSGYRAFIVDKVKQVKEVSSLKSLVEGIESLFYAKRKEG